MEEVYLHPKGSSRASKVVKWMVGGVLAGAIVGFALPGRYVAEVSLLFPTINASALKEVTKVLKLDGSGVEWSKSSSTSDSQMVEAASLVFRSRVAITMALRDAKITLSPTVLALQGDPVEFFRNHSLDVVATDGSLRLEVAYPRPEGARAVCQGLLDYYTTFVHEHRLTNTARTRQQLEEKLVRVDRRLSILERKLVLSPNSRLQTLSAMGEGRDSKVVRELWKQRILESGSSGRILDEMRKIRKDAAGADPGLDSGVGDDWRSRWGSTSVEDATDREAALPRNAKRSDLPSRLELERVYEETLLLYHAGLVQYDFLTVWEGLENFDFEIADPISVRQEASTDRIFLSSLVCGVLGALMALLSRRSA